MEIELTLKNYRCFEDTTPVTLRIRPGFTAFVGKNNSGKSSLVRFLYEFRHLFQSVQEHNVLTQMLRGQRFGFERPSSIKDAASLSCDYNPRDIQVTLKYSNDGWDPTQCPQRTVFTIARDTTNAVAEMYAHGGQKIDAHTNFNDTGTMLHSNQGNVNLNYWRDVCFLLADTFYIGPFRNAINVGGKTDYFDIKVGQHFVKQWREQQTGISRVNREATYKLTNDIQHIFEFDDLEIHPSDDEQTLQVLVNGKSFELLEVGSGITQFIMVLANVAVKRPSIILIDEPELNLHASLQLDFMTTLASYASHSIIFATHNYGLARSAADFVYAVARKGTGPAEVTPLESVKSLTEFVGALSFSSSPEFGFNRIVLVEGPTDARAIQQWLRLFGKEHLVLLLPLGGGSLINGANSTAIQLDEIRRITSSVTALIDSERVSESSQLDADREAFKALCAGVSIDCHVLERRALENYFPQDAIDRALGPGHHALGKHDLLKTSGGRWNKADNWRIAREMTKTDIDATDLGVFLGSL